jgi:hypothetical protein
LTCVEGCATGACYDGCDAEFAGAAAEYKPIYQCTCNGCSEGICDPALDACNK